MPKIDEKKHDEMFALMHKVSTHPEDLTKKEKERLKELDIEA